MAKVLLAHHEMTMVQMIGELLRSEGHQVLPFTHGPSAVAALATAAPELVVADLPMEKSDMAGLALLQQTRSMNPPPAVIMITQSGSAQTAVEAMKRGAYDYLEKPFALDELKLRVQRALSYRSALSENSLLRKQLEAQFQFKEIIGASGSIQEVIKLLERVADTDGPILICGRTGTGKRLVARAIHSNSRRRLAPFLTLSCSSSSEGLLDAELFGHRKGTFTDSALETQGVLQEAEGGTVLLQGVEALPASAQSRLLRTLQDREIRRMGDSVPISVDVRILAASSEPLEPKVAGGVFREDLYRCLSTVSVLLPSLKDRPEDIPLLVSHFLEGKKHRRDGKPFVLTRDAAEVCCAYDWPGNVGELQHAIERACALSEDSSIRVSDLPPSVQRLAPASEQRTAQADPPVRRQMTMEGPLAARSISSSGKDELIPLKRFLRDQELIYLRWILGQVGGSKERAAELLGISLATIYRKLSEPHVAGV